MPNTLGLGTMDVTPRRLLQIVILGIRNGNYAATIEILEQAIEQFPPDDTPTLHKLKTQKKFFDAVVAGTKKFEIRMNDRDFRVGDELLLQEIEEAGLTGREIRRRVVYMTDFQQMPGFVVMGIE